MAWLYFRIGLINKYIKSKSLSGFLLKFRYHIKIFKPWQTPNFFICFLKSIKTRNQSTVAAPPDATKATTLYDPCCRTSSSARKI